MDGFLKIVGGTIFGLSLLAGATILVASGGRGLAALIYLAPATMGGAAIYALGAILNNLIALRAAAERQADALGNIAAMQRRSLPPSP